MARTKVYRPKKDFPGNVPSDVAAHWERVLPRYRNGGFAPPLLRITSVEHPAIERKLPLHTTLQSVLDALEDIADARGEEQVSDLVNLVVPWLYKVMLPLDALIKHFSSLFKDHTAQQDDVHLPWGFLVPGALQCLHSHSWFENQDAFSPEDALASEMLKLARQKGGLLCVREGDPLASGKATSSCLRAGPASVRAVPRVPSSGAGYVSE